MSINTTSTSDQLATDSPTSSSIQDAQLKPQEVGRRLEGVSALMAGVPDPAVIAKLANEFFAALPNSEQSTGTASLPDYPREAGSAPSVPVTSITNDRSVPGGPQLASSFPTGASTLTEADFRAIASSLAGATPFAPQVSSVGLPVVAPATPSSSSSAPAGEGQAGSGSSPWAAAPQLPSTAGLYSFPNVPAIPSSPPTAPPSGADLAAVPASPTSIAPPIDSGRTDPWAAPPHFSGLNDVFSFPRVPGASVPGIPEVQTSQPSVPASQPVLGTLPSVPNTVPNAVPSAVPNPTQINNAPQTLPASPEVSPSLAIPEGMADFSDADSVVYPGLATKFPTGSELFSFPGVPGAQSAPGVPVVPTSIPTEIPANPDLASLPSALPASGILAPSIPGFPGKVPAAPASNRTAAPNNSLPQGIESVEFRPDLQPADLGVSKRPLDPRLIRQDFPILQERVNGRPLIWLDNAATTQKPNAVIDRLSYFYRHENSNVHRAAHTLAARATDAYESAREKTRRFLNASSTREVIFVRGTTEGINLVAKSWGHRNVQKDDEIVITWLEHHANIVPWQQLCSEKGARLRVAPVNDRGEVILEEYEKLLSPRTRIVSFSQVSNALGTITPAREMVAMAHRHGARVLVDGAQSVSHMRTDVQALDCDFYVFSGHKVFGPTGIGAVYGKLDVLDNMPPWQGGGNMIVDVTFEKTVYHPAPARFEAGTGNIADAVGLGAALDYVEQVGMESIAAYEHELLNYATAGLLTIPGLRLIGTAREKAGVLSFVLDELRTEDVGAALNQEGIAVRSGHHCAQPILRRMGVESTVRPSLALYNTCEDVDALVDALRRIQAGRGSRG